MEEEESDNGKCRGEENQRNGRENKSKRKNEKTHKATMDGNEDETSEELKNTDSKLEKVRKLISNY